jgi:hypothetical protein
MRSASASSPIEARRALYFPFVFDEVIGIELTNALEFDALIGMDLLGRCDFAMTRDGSCSLRFG